MGSDNSVIIAIIGLIALVLIAYLTMTPLSTRTEMPTVCLTMNLSKAISIAESSICMDNGSTLKENYVCNNVTETWWLDLNIPDSPAYCNPACVINIANASAEINWRCTGLIE